MRFLCAIRIVCWRVSVFYVAAVSAIPADGVPCGGRVLHGHLLALPPRCLVGWRGCFGRLPTPPLVYFPAPSPQPPSPVGKGEIFSFLMQGAPPLAFPALDRLRHLQNLPLWCLKGGYSPCGTCSPCPGGEDHLKRRSSSPPVPPLLGWRHCSPVPRPNRHALQGIGTPPQPRLARDKAPRRVPGRQLQSVPRGFNPGDARGGAPCMKITLSLPLPRWGRGSGGISFPFGEGGQKSKLKAGQAGDQNNRAHPQGTAAAGQAGDKEGKPHLRVPLTPRRAGAAQGHAPPAPHRAPPLFCHRPPPIKNSGKVLGGLGASFKKPPTHLCPRRL